MGALKLGIRVLVLKCPHLPTIVMILRRNFPSQKGPKGHKCAQLQQTAGKAGVSTTTVAPEFGPILRRLCRYDFPVFARTWVSSVDLATQSSILLSGSGGR